MGLRDYIPSVSDFRVKRMQSELKKTKQELALYKNGTFDTSDRGFGDVRGKGSGVIDPEYEYSLEDLEKLTNRSDILGSVLQTLRAELFKEGLTVVQSHDGYCPEGHKVEEALMIGEEKVCPQHKLVLDEVDKGEKRRLENVRENINQNDQSLRDVLREFEDDLNTFDMAFLHVRYDYYFDDDNRVRGRKFNEVYTGDPKNWRLVADSTGVPARNDDGDIIKFCPLHRDEKVLEREEQTITLCPHSDCESELKKAYYASSPSSIVGFSLGDVAEEEIRFYGKDEVIHKSKYEPSKTYGYPQTIKVATKVMTLLNEDEFLKDNFGDEMPPRTGLIVTSDADESSIRKSWKGYLKRVKENPVSIVPLVTPSQDDDWSTIDLNKSLDELEFTTHRKEFRSVIATTFNVMPMFAGDNQAAPFSRQSETQNLVTEKAIRDGVEVYREVLPKLSKLMGYEDYEFKLKQPDVRSEAEEVEMRQSKVSLAKDMMEIGMDVSFDGDEFEFSEPNEGLDPDQAPGIRTRGDSDSEDESVEEVKKEILDDLPSLSEEDSGEDEEVSPAELFEKGVLTLNEAKERMGLESEDEEFGDAYVHELKQMGDVEEVIKEQVQSEVESKDVTDLLDSDDWDSIRKGLQGDFSIEEVVDEEEVREHVQEVVDSVKSEALQEAESEVVERINKQLDVDELESRKQLMEKKAELIEDLRNGEV